MNKQRLTELQRMATSTAARYDCTAHLQLARSGRKRLRIVVTRQGEHGESLAHETDMRLDRADIEAAVVETVRTAAGSLAKL
jgi:hypothetical protein